MKQLIILVLLLTSSMLGAQFTGPEIPISYYHSDIRTVIAADLLYQFGEPDIIIESGDTAVVMFRNFDGQNFSGPMVLADYFDGISDMVAFDIDSDSDRDILVASGPDGGIFQLINAGAFEFFEQGTIAELGSQITDIKQDHVNNDGDLDIIFARVNPSEIGWIENEGNGDFADPVSLAIDIGYPTQVEAGDMNDDGAMDIVFLSLTQSKLYYLENWGAFFQPHEEIWSSTPGIEDFAIADIDLDGDLDIVLCSMAEDKVLWIEQTDGEFINSHIIDDQAWQVDQIELSDFDLDGDMDVVVSSRLSSSGKWYENAGNGEYEPGQLASPLHGEQVRRLLTVDLDGDGYEDILYSEDRTVGVSINDTSVDFDPLPLISPQIPIPQELTEIDLDSDGDLDILVGGFHELNWLVNQLDEDYGVNNLVDIGFSSSISGIDAGDIDMDDDEDIVYSLNNDSRLLSNDGMEQFETQVTMPDGGGYMGTTLNDLDGDGDLDLLLNHNTTIRVRENQGGGELGPWQDLASDVDRLISLHFEDVDGDGDEDIIAGDVFPSMLSTYENIGGLEFGEQQSWLQGTAGPRDIDLCD
ncbi:MAG: VCBS repeat-containing protein, partial [Flavobacteriales bacterium]|nr:VCBS repeat-containing protein [Flavobacteriales bacterium]